MTDALALVDSGTTRTRLRVWDGARVQASFTREVGARDVAREGRPDVLRAAVSDLLAQARRGWRVTAVVCSGMITSDVGLLNVPHVPAPADERALALHLRRLPDPHDADLGWYFIPGVRTGGPDLHWDTLDQGDVMRGEEVQVLGLRALLRLSGPALFLHLGSHHKAIWTGAEHEILRSRTALTGEVLAATAEHTVLRSSVGALDGWADPDPEVWASGLRASRALGFGRALFTVRLAHLTLGADVHALRSYLLGAVSALTLDLLPAPEDAPLLLLGAPGLAERLAAELRRLGWRDVRVLTTRQTEDATALGAQRILHAHLHGSELLP